MVKSMMTVLEENARAREFQRGRIDELITECAQKDKQINQLWNDHQSMKQKNAMLRQRPDLPVDRIPAYKEMRYQIDRLNRELELATETANNAIIRCQEIVIERDEAFDRCDELRNQLDNLKGA